MAHCTIRFDRCCSIIDAVWSKKREPRRIETRCGRAERRCPWVGAHSNIIYISIMIHLFLAPAAPEMSYQMCYRIATARSHIYTQREQKTSNTTHAVSMSQWKLMKFVCICAIYLYVSRTGSCSLWSQRDTIYSRLLFLPLVFLYIRCTICYCFSVNL